MSGNIFICFSVMCQCLGKDEVYRAVATVAFSIPANTCSGTLHSASEKLDYPGMTQLTYSTSSCTSVTHNTASSTAVGCIWDAGGVGGCLLPEFLGH